MEKELVVNNLKLSPVEQEKLRLCIIRTAKKYLKPNGKPLMIKFLNRLILDANRKIFLILDNLKVHHTTLVREWLKTRKKKITLFFLPPYAPEYNPDEYLNEEVKRSIAKKGYSVSINELESKVRSTMKTLQCKPKHIASYFKAEAIKYAA